MGWCSVDEYAVIRLIHLTALWIVDNFFIELPRYFNSYPNRSIYWLDYLYSHKYNVDFLTKFTPAILSAKIGFFSIWQVG